VTSYLLLKFFCFVWGRPNRHVIALVHVWPIADVRHRKIILDAIGIDWTLLEGLIGLSPPYLSTGEMKSATDN